MTEIIPTLLPIGDTAILVRFGTQLSEDANKAAIDFFNTVHAHSVRGAVEIAPNLVSVLVRYDNAITSFEDITGELRLILSLDKGAQNTVTPKHWSLSVSYGGEAGPDLAEVAAMLDMTPEAFIQRHTTENLRVLATGFAPGFVYCGFHKTLPSIARRGQVRPKVAAGSILFAAGQTAIAATAIPTGWHVIGRTSFRNFDVNSAEPTQLTPGDTLNFSEALRDK